MIRIKLEKCRRCNSLGKKRSIRCYLYIEVCTSVKDDLFNISKQLSVEKLLISQQQALKAHSLEINTSSHRHSGISSTNVGISIQEIKEFIHFHVHTHCSKCFTSRCWINRYQLITIHLSQIPTNKCLYIRNDETICMQRHCSSQALEASARKRDM